MNKFDLLQKIFSMSLISISLWGFILNLFLSAVLAIGVGRIYVKYGESLSNRLAFSKIFVMLAMTTMLIITIVKSSLALSLGLIGALSIVRFRAAIKEPEELSYLFFSIAIGLGLGANQRLITITAFCVILFVVWLKNKFRDSTSYLELKMYVTVTTHSRLKISTNEVIEIIEKNCITSKMKRMDKSDSMFEACFLVDFKDKKSLQGIEDSLFNANSSIIIKFLDYEV